jgi:hypothetical protein
MEARGNQQSRGPATCGPHVRAGWIASAAIQWIAMTRRKTSWQLNRINVVFGLIALLGILQFFCMSCWAIRNYPGGYSVAGHFLSDLGRRTTLDGSENSVCSRVFSRSVVALGIALIPFFAVMPMTFDSGRSVLGGSGVLSASGLIGIGLTPYDDYFVLHHIALGIWVVPMLVMVITFLVLARSAGAASVILSIGSVLVVLAILGYALAGDHNGYVIMQKVLAVLAVTWLCLVFITVSVSTVRAVSSRRVIAEQQAEHYLQSIRKNHRRRTRTKARG